MDITHEDRQSLWLITSGPAIWIAHFAVVYASAAVWCARITSDGSLGAVHRLVLALTVVAVAGIAVVARAGWRRHRHGDGTDTAPHDADTPEDRHRFIGLATLLLALLSGVATLFVGAAAFFFETCR